MDHQSDIEKSLLSFSHILRHTDPYYLNADDILDIVNKSMGVLPTWPLSQPNVPILCSAMMVNIEALYEACSHKEAIRRPLGFTKVVHVGDPKSAAGTTEYQLHKTDKWQYIMSPPSLKLAVRDTVRRVMRTNIPRKIRTLPLPECLRIYLNIPELDSLQEEYCSYNYVIQRHQMFNHCTCT